MVLIAAVGQLPAGAGAAVVSSVKPPETRGQLFALLGHRAVLRTMYTASAVTSSLSWFLCHCLYMIDNVMQIEQGCVGQYYQAVIMMVLAST